MTDEYLGAMRAIWGQAKPAYQGRFVSFDNVQAHPQPVQRLHPPFVIGGTDGAGVRRAVSQGHGWYGFGLDSTPPDGPWTAHVLAAAETARPAGLDGSRSASHPAVASVSISRPSRNNTALGVDRLILMPSAKLDADGLERYVQTVGRELVGRG